MVKAPKPKLTAANGKQKKSIQGKVDAKKAEKKPPQVLKMKPEKPNKKALQKVAKTAKANGATAEKKTVKPKKLENPKPKQTKSATAAAPKGAKVKAAKPQAAKAAQPVRKIVNYEPVHVEEKAFDAIVNLEKVTKITKALKQLVEGEVAKQKTSIFGDYSYCLNVACFKIPSCPKRMVKVNLKHSLVNIETDDVVIVVPDLQRGAKVEYDSTIEHYTDLLREAGVEGLKIMPFNQLRNEYKTFEAKHKLASTYDYYLCDGRIVSKVAGLCGTIFQKPRTTFHAVRMDRPKALKTEIQKALRRSAYRQLCKGDLITIIVGNDKLDAEQVAENVMHVIAALKNSYPGGITNMREIDLKINIKGTSSLPIYISTSEGPQEPPYIVGPREQHMLELKKEANEVLSKFNLTKDAELKRLNKDQVARKRKLKETRAELLAEKNATKTETVGGGGEDIGEEIDEEEAAERPVKKAKVEKPEKKQKVEKAQKKQQKIEVTEKKQKAVKATKEKKTKKKQN